MMRIRRFRSLIAAEAAAAHLRAGGVVAVVVGQHAQGVWGLTNLPGVGLDLVILNKGDRARAESLLAELDAEPLELDEGWEAAAEPDLSAIDTERYPVTCPACRHPLPARERHATCPECGGHADLLKRIVEQHGPEALEACYEDAGAEDEPMPAPEPEDLHLPCPSCGYSLGALPARGRCPECGGLFDKDQMLRDLSG